MKHKTAPHGLVPKTLLLPYLRELIDRCGSKREVAERYGIARSVQIKTFSGNNTMVQKRTIQRTLTALAEQRRLDRLNNGTSQRYATATKLRGQRDHQMSTRL
jgi:hypothetical protein